MGLFSGLSWERQDTLLLIACCAFVGTSTWLLTSHYHDILYTDELLNEESTRSSDKKKEHKRPDDHIPLSELETLCFSPAYEIRQAAIALVDQRYKRHPYARRITRDLLHHQLRDDPAQNATFQALEEHAQGDGQGHSGSQPGNEATQHVQVLAIDQNGNALPVVGVDDGVTFDNALEALLSALDSNGNRTSGQLRPGQRVYVDEMVDSGQQDDAENQGPGAASDENTRPQRRRGLFDFGADDRFEPTFAQIMQENPNPAELGSRNGVLVSSGPMHANRDMWEYPTEYLTFRDGTQVLARNIYRNAHDEVLGFDEVPDAPRLPTPRLPDHDEWDLDHLHVSTVEIMQPVGADSDHEHENRDSHGNQQGDARWRRREAMAIIEDFNASRRDPSFTTDDDPRRDSRPADTSLEALEESAATEYLASWEEHARALEESDRRLGLDGDGLLPVPQTAESDTHDSNTFGPEDSVGDREQQQQQQQQQHPAPNDSDSPRHQQERPPSDEQADLLLRRFR